MSPTPQHKMKVVNRLLLAASTLLGAFDAFASNITWQTPVRIAGASDVRTNGIYFGSWAPHGAGAELLPVNGVTFRSNDLPRFTINSWFQNNSSGFGSPGTANANYNTLLQSGRFSNNGTAGHFSFNGLTPGHTYLIQLWVEDMRVIGARRWENVYGDEGAGGQSGPVDFPSDGTSRGTYVVGTFTADGTGQQINFNTWSTVSGMQVAQVNLFHVRDITAVPQQSIITASGDDLNANTAAGIAALQQWYNNTSGLWTNTGWWNAANCIEVVENHIIANNDSNQIATLRNTFNRNSAGNFLNSYYDEEGWWANAWTRAYDITGDARYLNMAKTIFADMTNGWGNPCGGGIWWSKAQTYKNAIANELFILVAIRLHQRTPGDMNYFYWATNGWAWFNVSGMINAQNLVNDGLTSGCANNGQSTWSYNQGVILGALAELYRTTGDTTYLARAEAIADAALNALPNAAGVLAEASPCNPTCGGGDVPQFKGIFVRNLATLYDINRKPSYLNHLFADARAVWTRDRNASNQFGMSWTGPVDSVDAARQSSAVMALSSLAAPITAALPFAKGSGDWAFNHSVGMATGTLAWACSPAVAGSAGLMQSGPFLSSLSTGSHTAHFRMAVSALSSSAASLVSYEVRENGILRASGQARWNAFTRTNHADDFRLPFTNIVAGGALECRVNWNNVAGAPTLTLSDVTIDGAHNWTAANLEHDIGRLDAHHGWSADPVRDTGSGYMSKGPGTAELATGAWRAEFELKVDNFNRDNNTVATLSVVDVDANRVVASRDIARSEFPNARYRSFDLYFPAVAGTRYDFRVYWNYGSTAPRLTQRSVIVRAVTGQRFASIELTADSYNQDMVVEDTGAHPPLLSTTASMDNGVINDGNTWYARGYNTAFPNTGLPNPGSSITNSSSTDHVYTFAPSFTSNNVAMIDASHGGNFVLATRRAYSALSFLTAAGHGPVTINYRANHEDGSFESGQFVSPDWFFNAPVAFNAQGRVDLVSGSYNNVNNGNPRLYGVDVGLTNIASAVTNIVLGWNTNSSVNGVAAIFALSGVAVEPADLSITRAGGQVKLNWAFGKLLEAQQVTGPWTTNDAAVAPYLIQTGGPSRFFRVQMH
jgi:predicted alpha-1,6-mannanase (GH76 family)